MKKRIISFVLTLVMLFSCLSLEIFATENINAEAKMGVNSTNPSASGESLSASELADPIAEYFEKYGTIGKSGGFNLDSRAFENKVDGSNIILNTDFPTAAKYSNTNSSWSYSGLTIKNDKTFERIVPVEKDGNYYLQWHPTPIATKSTGAYFDNLAKNEDGTYNITEDNRLHYQMSKNHKIQDIPLLPP